MFIEQFLVEGLGCLSYMIFSEKEKLAAVIDVDRDVRKYIHAAEKHGATITHIFETHLHADHISGNTELAARTGAAIFIHELAGAGFQHQPIRHGDVIQVGEVNLAVRHTPGHTPESVTYLLSDTSRSPEAWMALTGDLLLVNDVGRPDLVGPEAARTLAEQMYGSLFDRLAAHEDSLLIYPGHSSGSLCARSIHSARSTTLGFERRFNPAFQSKDAGIFVEQLTKHLPEQPANHHAIKASNRRGPEVLGDARLQPLTLDAAIKFFQQGCALLDTRPKGRFIEMHVPGSVHLEADSQLPNRLGFILPPEQPLILLCEPEQYEAIVYNLRRVGYEKIPGYLEGGIEEWNAAGLPVSAGDIQDVTANQLASLLAGDDGEPPVVIDVREPWEFATGHIPEARLIPLGKLAANLGDLDPTKPVAVVCAHGNRSRSASALFGQKGFERVYNLLDGMAGWKTAGLPVKNSIPHHA